MREPARAVIGKALLLIALAGLIGLAVNAARGGPALFEPPARVEAADPMAEVPAEPGRHVLSFKAARAFLDQGLGIVIDARDPAAYALGHLPGAVNVYLYELERFLPPLLEQVSPEEPLLIYCSGANCEDSHHLAEELQAAGYQRLYVFQGGFQEWEERQMPLERGEGYPAPAPERGAKLTVNSLLDLSLLLPAWIWLLADFLLLGLGLWALAAWAWGLWFPFSSGWRLVGLLFVLASLHKIAAPGEFARAIDGYRILPGTLVNLAAVVLPWLELIGGGLLLVSPRAPLPAGRLVAPAALLVLGLTALFILAIGFNLARGLEFDCGCFGRGHVSAWRVLLRDVGLFLLAVPALICPAAGKLGLSAAGAWRVGLEDGEGR